MSNAPNETDANLAANSLPKRIDRDLSAQASATQVSATHISPTHVSPTQVSAELAVIVAPASPTAKKMLSIASQLQHLHVDMGVRSFCFVGDDRGVGTTVVAANVAAAFAISGQRTMLLEANFRTPRVAPMFGLDAAAPGLSEWLAGLGDTSNWSGYMQPAYQNLVVMPAGQSLSEGEPYLPTELRHLMIEMSRMFDVVICDAAPMADVTGSLAAAVAAERSIVVARAHQTRMKALLAFQDLIKQSGGAIGGTVYLDF